MADPQDPQDPAHPGNPGGNPPGNPDPNVVALQQKLTERDRELKEAQKALEEAKKASENKGGNEEVRALTEQVTALTTQISALTGAAEKEKLKTKYPDILPDLLIGKSEAEIENLVAEQRKVNEARYGSMPSSHAPQYKDVTEVDKAIEDVKGDRSLTTEQKMQKLRELKLKRQEF